MLTNDNIIYFLNIKCSKERVYTNWLFFVSLKLILKFFCWIGQDWIGQDRIACDLVLSCILHPASGILHPASYILHPTSYIMHPASYIQHPTSYIQHPASYIQHPTSYILSYPKKCKSLQFKDCRCTTFSNLH